MDEAAQFNHWSGIFFGREHRLHGLLFVGTDSNVAIPRRASGLANHRFWRPPWLGQAFVTARGTARKQKPPTSKWSNASARPRRGFNLLLLEMEIPPPRAELRQVLRKRPRCNDSNASNSGKRLPAWRPQPFRTRSASSNGILQPAVRGIIPALNRSGSFPLPAGLIAGEICQPCALRPA